MKSVFPTRLWRIHSGHNKFVQNCCLHNVQWCFGFYLHLSVRWCNWVLNGDLNIGKWTTNINLQCNETRTNGGFIVLYNHQLCFFLLTCDNLWEHFRKWNASTTERGEKIQPKKSLNMCWCIVYSVYNACAIHVLVWLWNNPTDETSNEKLSIQI